MFRSWVSIVLLALFISLPLSGIWVTAYMLTVDRDEPSMSEAEVQATLRSVELEATIEALVQIMAATPSPPPLLDQAKVEYMVRNGIAGCLLARARSLEMESAEIAGIGRGIFVTKYMGDNEWLAEAFFPELAPLEDMGSWRVIERTGEVIRYGSPDRELAFDYCMQFFLGS